MVDTVSLNREQAAFLADCIEDDRIREEVQTKLATCDMFFLEGKQALAFGAAASVARHRG